jgi:DNA (cytosine-5)-methyltransferase 1
MTFGSLFAGIGGMDLGLERAGMECRWQVEIDPYCRQVLERHWPAAKRFEDVCDVGSHNLERVDLIAGGFPCQDISYAGEGAGIRGERSGLWFEFARIIREMGPRYVLVENVAALLDRGMGDVLGTLADCGYDAEWSCVSSCSLGATHMRRRVFIVAYPHSVVGRQGLWDSIAQRHGQVQAVAGFSSARAGAKARVANPSELYGGANAVPFGPQRVKAIGNAVDPNVAEYIGNLVTRFDRANEGITTLEVA